MKRVHPLVFITNLIILLTFPTHLLSGQPDKKSTEAENKDKIENLWTFDNDIPGLTIDKIQNIKDSIYGKYEYVKGVKGQAIKLDGFRTFVKTSGKNQQFLSDAFTIEAWIAPAAYPWSWSPVFDCTDQRLTGFFFGIDNIGRVGFNVAAGSSWYEVKSRLTIPLREWSHIAAVFKANEQITIFINGENVASLNIDGAYLPSRRSSFPTIGRNIHSQVWKEAQLTTAGTYFFLDGLLDEICIYGNVRTGKEIKEEINGLGKLLKPTLSERGIFPKGPVGSGSFGAYYAKLDYYKEWDDMWRVSNDPDVYVRFDSSPVQLIFWRGTSLVPCWVSENDIWYTNEWLETWGKDVVSCAEPLMDRQCRYSHVRIIENNDARVVVHWRYALADAFYNFVAVSDDGRGEWCDEYFIIYPDNVGVRKMELHYSKPERKHDWVEQIVLTPPGKYPSDLIEKESISLVNMNGEIKNYLWHENLEIEMAEPKGANISYVNLKSEYRPFIIVSPDPVNSADGVWDSPYFRTYAANMAGQGIRPDPVPTVYGWWNHWPVAQIPGDGRWIVTPDKPGHFNLTTFVQWKEYNKTENTKTRIMLQGMTKGKAGELVTLAKSWLHAPEMVISSKGFEGGIYDEAEMAYILEKTINSNTPLEFIINGSEESPVINPAIIIKNWGNQPATLSIDGKNMIQGKDFRQGIRKGPDGDDLILWIRLNRQSAVDIAFGMRK
jgi:hypothetical protein